MPFQTKEQFLRGHPSVNPESFILLGHSPEDAKLLANKCLEEHLGMWIVAQSYDDEYDDICLCQSYDMPCAFDDNRAETDRVEPRNRRSNRLCKAIFLCLVCGGAYILWDHFR